MSLVEPVFVFGFFPMVFLGVLFLHRVDKRYILSFITLASLAFYAWGDVGRIGYFGLSVLSNYFLGMMIAARPNPKRRRWLVAGISFNLLGLALAKYLGFISTQWALLGLDLVLPVWAAPLAISFFTFQQIAYLVDVHRGMAAEDSLGRYLLWVSFFPRLIAGPISRYQDERGQWSHYQKPTLEDLAVGLILVGMGLFKKLILAAPFAALANAGHNGVANGFELTWVEAWVTALAYSLQIYFDFSGYSDMALGTARLLGIRLPANFLSPYQAKSIIEFWRRWHITLSHFLRDYLYHPLGGNRRGWARQQLHLMVTMGLGGLWHGAGWNFLIWGLIHGTLLSLNHSWRRWVSITLPRWIAVVLTFTVVTLAWVFFRAEEFNHAISLISAMFGGNGWALPLTFKTIFHDYVRTIETWGIGFTGLFNNGVLGDPVTDLAQLLCGLVWVMILPNSLQLLASFQPALKVGDIGTGFRLTLNRKTGFSFGVVIALAITAVGSDASFIYFRF